MSHKDSQSDTPERKHLKSNGEPFTDIGEVKITQTLFGKIKIQEIHKQDNNSRSGLLTAIWVSAIAAISVLGWIATHQPETLPGTDPAATLSSGAQQDPTDSRTENSLTTPAATGKSKSLTQTDIGKPASVPKSTAQQPAVLKATAQQYVKPVTSQVSNAGKPQSTSIDTNNMPSKIQSDMQQPAKLAPPSQQVAPAVASPPAIQPAEKPSATAAPAVAPLVKQDSPIPSPDTVSVQSK